MRAQTGSPRRATESRRSVLAWRAFDAIRSARWPSYHRAGAAARIDVPAPRDAAGALSAQRLGADYTGVVDLAGDGSAAASKSSPKACPKCSASYPPDALYCALDGSLLAGAPSGASANDPYIGREIAPGIEIRQLVGAGSMGRVYRGFQKGIERDVAVKILHRELSASPGVVARFHREAKVASHLAHPHVVHILLLGQLADGAMYIVMEYLDGLSLQSVLVASGGAIPLTRALHVTLAICAAAGEAHAKGVVHRDLKPENVMLVTRGDDPDFVKVLDFGIARLNWGDPSMGSGAGLIFGSARYISPEGAQGDAVGPPADVYAIATMLYQMLAGQTPFDARQAVGLLVQQIHDPAPPLQSIGRALYVPDRVAAVVMRNLAKRPEERAPNARDFGRELLDAALSIGLSARDVLTHPGIAGGRDGNRSFPPSDARPPARTERPEPESSTLLDATMDDRRQPVQPPAGPPSPRSERPAPASPSPSSARSGLSVGIVTAPGGTRGSTHAPSFAGPPTSARSPGSRHPVARLSMLLACMALGLAAAAGIASRVGWPSARRGASSGLDSTLARANDALLRERWDEPPTDNLRDITEDGLSRWPNEPQLLRIRSLACNDIVKAARAKRDEGNFGEALHIAKLANRFDPSDDAAQKLAGELESQSIDAPVDSVPPLVGVRSATAALAAASSVGVQIDALRPKANVGQPTVLSAHVTGLSGARGGKVEGASFRVLGPGGSEGVELDAVEDGSGVFRGTFTFAKEGRYEVTFGGRVNGAPVRAARSFVVTSSRLAGSSSSGAAKVAPAAPQASAKWL